jgi:glutathione S-transferase
MGDIPCAVCLYRYFNMGLEVERPPHLLDWYRRLGERAAYRATVMLPFDELSGRTQF